MKNPRSDKQPEANYDEEREGLLTGKEGVGEHDELEHQDVSRKRVYLLAAALAIIMLGAVFIPGPHSIAQHQAVPYSVVREGSHVRIEIRGTFCEG